MSLFMGRVNSGKSNRKIDITSYSHLKRNLISRVVGGPVSVMEPVLYPPLKDRPDTSVYSSMSTGNVCDGLAFPAERSR